MVCEHGRQRSQCKDCKALGIGGEGICEHDKNKYDCKDCKNLGIGGNGICEHGKQKSKCKVCCGSSICTHNRIKSKCVECKGSGICQHNKRKSQCVECGGSSICQHNKRKQNCTICNPNCACQNCLHVYVNPNSLSKPYCFPCYCVLNPDADIKRRYMLKEHYMRQTLIEKLPDIKMTFNKTIEGGCSLIRPDVLIECLTHSIVIECDEYRHKNIVAECENMRTMKIFETLANRPLVMLRFNPDEYKGQSGCFKNTTTQGYTIDETEWNRRTITLIEKIKFHMTNIPTKELIIEQLYY